MSMNESAKRTNAAPLVEIRSNGSGTRVYIDGNEIELVESVSFEFDPMRNLNPILTLRIRACNFCITTNTIPNLPAPWAEFYEFKPKYKDLILID